MSKNVEKKVVLGIKYLFVILKLFGHYKNFARTIPRGAIFDFSYFSPKRADVYNSQIPTSLLRLTSVLEQVQLIRREFDSRFNLNYNFADLGSNILGQKLNIENSAIFVENFKLFNMRDSTRNYVLRQF